MHIRNGPLADLKSVGRLTAGLAQNWTHAAQHRSASIQLPQWHLELSWGIIGYRNQVAYQPPMLLWPKPLDLRLERRFDRPVRRLNGDHARPGIGDTASLADALNRRTLL